MLMPSIVRLFAVAVTGAVLLPLAACGDKKAEQTSTTQMKDLEVVDGSVNDAMTDLDGVKSEGTALADTGGNTIAAPAATNASATGKPATVDAADAKAEVVADQ
jgi:hypothetical protein